MVEHGNPLLAMTLWLMARTLSSKQCTRVGTSRAMLALARTTIGKNVVAVTTGALSWKRIMYMWWNLQTGIRYILTAQRHLLQQEILCATKCWLSRFIPTWYEPSHATSLGDNGGTLTMDLYGYVPDRVSLAWHACVLVSSLWSCYLLAVDWQTDKTDKTQTDRQPFGGLCLSVSCLSCLSVNPRLTLVTIRKPE